MEKLEKFMKSYVSENTDQFHSEETEFAYLDENGEVKHVKSPVVFIKNKKLNNEGMVFFRFNDTDDLLVQTYPSEPGEDTRRIIVKPGAANLIGLSSEE